MVTKVQGYVLSLLAQLYGALDTALTYHRTWEIGLEGDARVSSSNPKVFKL